MTPLTLPGVSAELLSLRAGAVAPLGPEGMASAIRKSALDGRVMLTRAGVPGDAQADTLHHGGPDKALHVYPSEHYAEWRRELSGRAHFFEIGAFGENLSTRGLTEVAVCLGDVFTLGDAVIQVSQGRQPCAKLNLRFEQPDMPRRVLQTGRSGWYFRVLVAGAAGAGDRLSLIERPQPEWPLTRVWAVLFEAPEDWLGLAALAGMPLLSGSWRERAARRLADSPKT